MSSAARTMAKMRTVALVVFLLAGQCCAAEDTAKEKSTPLPTSALVEPRWSWRSSGADLTCPPPEVFYSSCHMSGTYVTYRADNPRYYLQHDDHFRPSSRPILPPDPGYHDVRLDRTRDDPWPQPPPPNPTLVTFVAEEARRGDWWRASSYGSYGTEVGRGQFGRPLNGWREETGIRLKGFGYDRGPIGCYRLQRRDERLENHILQVVQSRELRDCEEACNRDRRCVSFNFRSDPVEIVCELTDMDSYARYAQFRPISGWDFYERDTSSYCSGWDNNFYNTNNFGYAYCSMRVRDNSLLNVNAVRRDITARSLADCEQACRDETNFRCETFSFGITPGSRRFSCQLTDLRISELSARDTEPRRNFEIYDYHGNGRECDRPNDQYDYRHGHLETCSGRACARGPCRIDRSGGYWYCFTDSAEAVWDYCCDPDSPCQRDVNMQTPICHVTQRRSLYRNAGLDTAWRPCEYVQSRFAYLTRNSTDHVVAETSGNTTATTAAAATGGTIDNELLETIDLAQERKKHRD